MSQPVQIPFEAMKDIACVCGCKSFLQNYKIKFYPGGLYSAMPLVNPVPVFFCVECGKEVSIEDKINEQKKKFDKSGNERKRIQL
jgi:hypothetical protein